ncbi:ArsA family ATPase [Chloroflexales bacterium ZM16-3]|nr:ArsA family ATPase [Chloroflexales bacterium ZM16-3]
MILIFVGSSGGATATAAAATAAAAAAGGRSALIASIGPSHSVGPLLGVAPSSGAPQHVAPGLDLWALNALEDLGTVWGDLRGRAGGTPASSIGAEELPIIPGSDLFLAVARLHHLSASYDLICVDAGHHDALLRALGVPDTFRWSLRLLLGLDREPGRSSASMSRAMVPSALIPFEWIGQVQDARVKLERLRDETVAPAQTRVRYVLRPDRGGLEEAALALPALQLFGLSVEQIIAGPLLPEGLTALGLMVAEQRQVLADAAQTWAELPMRRLAAAATPGGVPGLVAIGAALYTGGDVMPGPPAEPPLRLVGPPDPHVAIDMPGLRREHLGLTLSGDELIVRAGPYRRHILLPEGMRGGAAIRASRQGDTLVIRPRQAGA